MTNHLCEFPTPSEAFGQLPPLGLDFDDLLRGTSVFAWAGDMQAFAVSWIPIIKRWEAGNYEILQPTLANPISAVMLVCVHLVQAATTKGTSLSLFDSVVLYEYRASVVSSIYLKATQKHVFVPVCKLSPFCGATCSLSCFAMVSELALAGASSGLQNQKAAADLEEAGGFGGDGAT